MKKKISVLTACILGVCCIAIGASAVGVIQQVQSELRPDFTIVIDGEEQTFKNAQGETVYPLLYDGTTYLPVRAIGNMMGKTVYWYEDEKRIELKDSSSTVTDADVIVPSGSSATPTPTSTPDSGEITLEQAKEIALAKAGVSASDVVFTEERLERDDGVRQYDLEFWKDNVSYSAEIRASDGLVLSWDVDYDRRQPGSQTPADDSGSIGVERAKEIALERAGLTAADVVFTQASYEIDDGIPLYEIEFRQGRVEYSAEVHASNGTVLSWDVDYD